MLGGIWDAQGSVSAELLSRALGVCVCEVRREPIASGGLHSRIYACSSEIGDLILRVCKGEQGFYTQYFPDMVDGRLWVDQAWATGEARSVGVPAPEIVCSDRESRWTVTKRLPGRPIDSEYERWDGCPYDERCFGECLRRLHSVEPSGYGPVDDLGHTLFPTWPAFLLNAAESALSTCVARGSMSAVLAAELGKCWFARLREAAMDRPSLLHLESLGFANILYEPETRGIAGLLDYEDCIGGDPAFEICWMEYYFECDSQKQSHFDLGRFADGYGELHADADRLALYTPFPLLDKLQWIEPCGARAQRYNRRLEDYAARL